MKFITTPVKGMCDMLPADMRLREHVFSMIKENYARYGFMQIETPVMEHIENLTSKQGGDNEKLIFKVMKRGRDLTKALESGSDELADNGLRYDLTVPLARYYAGNKEKLPSPFPALQMGPVFRADNPQKGRFRQFTQCDIDILGDDTNLAEITLIAATADMLSKIFAEVGIKGFTVHVNDRRILTAAALKAGFSTDDVPSVFISLDKMDKIGLDGIRKELIENGYEETVVDRYLSYYGGNTSEDAAATSGKSIKCEDFCQDFDESVLPGGVVSNLNEILESASAQSGDDVTIVFDPTLVRGMGYYTGPVFEVTIDGYGFAIAGGGRYDEMIGKFSGQATAAAGFSIGFERIITILKDQENLSALKPQGEPIAILIQNGAPSDKKLQAFAEAKKLREEGRTVTIQPMRKNTKAQVEKLEAEGYKEFRKIYAD